MISINGIRNIEVEEIMDLLGDDYEMLASVISQFMIEHEMRKYDLTVDSKNPYTKEPIASTHIVIEKTLINRQEG